MNSARLRLQLNIVLCKSSHFLLAFSFLILVLAIIDRAGITPFIPWSLIWIISGMIFVLVLLTSWIKSPITDIEAATEIDSRMQLHDRISSAIACEDTSEPFCEAVVEDAIEVAQSKSISSNVRTYFPIMLPKNSSSIGVAGLIAFVVLWTPQWGLWNENGVLSTSELVASEDDIEYTIDAVLEQLENEELLSKSLEDELAELAATNVNESLDSETLRRDALKKITDVQKRLDELMQDENALSFEEMLRRMKALKMPKNSNMQPMVADMKNGNFDQAKKEFEKLEKQLESSELSEEEREQLAKAMEDLAKQLQKLSQSNEALASAMSAAGLNGNFASNPDAAMKAIQNAKELTQEQKKQLMELLKAQQNASKMCNKMGEACKQCAGGKSGEGMASELEKLKAMQMFKTQAQLAKSMCQNAAQGMCSGGKGKNQGGTGGEGQGNGGSNPTTETGTSSVAQRSPVQTLEGTIIARQLFEGGLLTMGESTAAVRETVLAQQRDAEQAIIDEEVPRRYHELLRHYFGQLEELTDPSNEDDTESIQ